MPNAKVLKEKQEAVSLLAEKLRNSKCAVLVDYKGINVEQDTAMRVELRQANVSYSVVKNTLTKRACEQAGFTDFNGCLEGMTALATCGDDPVAPARILCKYAEKIPTFSIKAGCSEGRFLDGEGVQKLSALPAREVLIARMLGSMKSPIVGLALILKALGEKLSEENETPA